jgi:DNA-binding IclR family transcriptional regulator
MTAVLHHGVSNAVDGNGDSLSSIAKAARVLRALAQGEGRELGVTDVAERVALPKSTTHRVLSELMAEGLVGRSGLRYCLGPAWFALQSALGSSEWVQLSERARQPLAQLFEQTGATVHLAVLDGEQVLYLEKLTAKGGTAIPTRVGVHMPATCTALGKSLLAFAPPALVHSVLVKPLPVASRLSIQLPRLLATQLAEIRHRGLAFDVEECQPGLYCVAAPVIRDGRVIAAVSLSRVNVRSLTPTDGLVVQRAAHQVADWLPLSRHEIGRGLQSAIPHR